MGVSLSPLVKRQTAMSFSSKTRYLLGFLAISTGALIEHFRGYRSLIVIIGYFTFLFVYFAVVYLSGSKERALRRKQKREYYAGLLLITLACTTWPAHAQLLPEPAIPPKVKKEKRQPADLEWMYQYSPPPADGREHELIQDPAYHPFLTRFFTAPQSFWGPQPTDPKAPIHKSLAETVDDFLTIPGKVLVDDNRYLTVTGAVRRLPAERGLVFVDLNAPDAKRSEKNSKDPLVLFAAIDWIRDAKVPSDPEAQFTLWIFANQPPGTPQAPQNLPPAVLRALTRWMAEPLAGSGNVQKITNAILVDADGTPHQIPVPATGSPASQQEAPALTKRK